MNMIEHIVSNVKLKEGKKVIEKFLVHLYIHGSTSAKALAQELSIPVPLATAIKKEGIKAGIIETDKNILTLAGRQFVEMELNYEGIDAELLKSLLYNRGFKNRYINQLSERIEGIYQGRPPVDVTLDQAFGTSKTAVKRALLCLENFSLIGKSVLCVGDDDLISISLALLLKELFPGSQKSKARLVVLDVDQGILDYIQQIAARHQLNIHCHQLNFKDRFPEKFTQSFDCFFTDPPYTIQGMNLFLSRGIQGLKKEKGKPIFLSFGKKSVEENFKLQQDLIQQGLSIKTIIDSFNEYHGASLLGNQSQMIVLETTDFTKPLLSLNASYEEPIYTREINSMLKS